MAATTQYLVIPFVVEKKKLKAAPTEVQRSEQAAIKAAERIGATKAGAVALAQEVDPDADYFGEPRILTLVGQIPEGFVEGLAA